MRIQNLLDRRALYGLIGGVLSDQLDLYAALGGIDVGGPSDANITDWEDNPASPNFGRVLEYNADGLGWVIAWHTDGRPDTLTHGALVRQFVYDGVLRPTGVTGPKFQGGSLCLTYAQMLALAPTVPGLKVCLLDVYPQQEMKYSGTRFRSPTGEMTLKVNGATKIFFRGGSATYTRAAKVVTVTQTGHGFTAAHHNGATIYLTQNAGDLVTGWFDEFTYVDANTFTCVDRGVGGTVTSNNLGTIATGVDIAVDGYTTPIKMKLMGPDGSLVCRTKGSCTNNATVKNIKVKFGGQEILNPALTSKASWNIPFEISNNGTVARQKGWVTSNDQQVGTSTGGLNPYAIDTDAADVDLIYYARFSGTDSNVIFEGMSTSLRH